MRRFRLFPLILAVILFICPVLCPAEEESAVKMAEKEWTWEEKNIASFGGEMKTGGLPEGKLLMKLSIATEPKATNPGEVVFQTVNGKKLTLKKQKAEYVFDHKDQDELTFIGNWKTPDDVYFTKVEITFQICTEDGESVLAEQKLTVSRTAAEVTEKDDGKIRLKADFSTWILWGAIAAAAIWILAVLRIVLNRIKQKKER